MNFGERLSEERKRMSLNQTEFGKIAGVTKTSQINYESGERKPNVDYLQAISAVGVDVQYILTGVRSINTSEINKEETKETLQRVVSEPIEPKPPLQRVVFEPIEPEPPLQRVVFEPIEPEPPLQRIVFDQIEPEPPANVYKRRAGDVDDRIGKTERRVEKAVTLLNELTPQQQLDVLATIEEKKQLNEMKRTLDRLASDWEQEHQQQSA